VTDDSHKVTHELAPEDALRLAVLLAGEVHALRIDEGRLELAALTPKGEALVPLHPNCRPDQYLARVREQLGGHALGYPGGYPVHLRHWTRVGQSNPKNLEALLKLAEPEAVAAVAHAPDLSDELARRAWWALPTVETARALLAHPAVRAGATGPVLAAFLVEHLPFEADPVAATETVRAVLAAGLLNEAARRSLWQKARSRPHYYIGFLEFLPDALPADEAELALADAAFPGGHWGETLARCRSTAGRAWLRAAEQALERPPAHDTVYRLLDLIEARFSLLREAPGREALAEFAAEAEALAALAATGPRDAEPILSRTTAVGPLMRRKLEPVLAPLITHLKVLRGP
jgi:hypothetical protein